MIPPRSVDTHVRLEENRVGQQVVQNVVHNVLPHQLGWVVHDGAAEGSLKWDDISIAQDQWLIWTLPNA